MKHPIHFTKFVSAISIFLAAASLLFAESTTLTAPDGTTVTINRDAYGVPHIIGESEVGIFFGQGFAVARDRLFQLEKYRRNAEGKLAAWFGSDYLEMDKDTRTMYYTAEERRQQFNELPAKFQVMLEAYRDGINTYLDSMGVNPAEYKPKEFNSFEMERWTAYKSIAIIQLIARNFGQFGGKELDRLDELRDNGQSWFDANRPINDVGAPTTIQGGGSTTTRSWRYSGIGFSQEVIQYLTRRRNDLKLLAEGLRLPLKLGSFAVLISTAKSNAGNTMLLGAPQMGTPSADTPSLPHEVELNCPTFHAGGMTVAGIPMILIGHTEHHAWTVTSGISDNIDVYIDSTIDASFSKYIHNNQWLDFEVIEDTISSGGAEIPFTHYRTIHGPVFGEELENHLAGSMKMTFWKQELDMLKFFDGIIRATSLEEFEAAAALMPMSFNLFYAGNDRKIKFRHIGKYQDRSDGVDPRLPHKGDGSEEWGGFIDFDDLPAADNTAQNYFVNWNNKPVSWWDNGDNVPWIGSNSVTKIDNFVGPITGFSFANLKDVPRQINDHGTYQQAIEFAGAGIIDENVLPPGQSGFIDSGSQPSPHFADQWPLHVNWAFKDMEFGQTPVGVASHGPAPVRFALHQNYPNPFNPETTIGYQLPKTGMVTLNIYNLPGQEVRTLVNTNQTAGKYSIIWDGKNDAGELVTSGMYFYKLQASNTFTTTRKMLLLK